MSSKKMTNQTKNEWNFLTSIEKIIFNLNKENISQSVKSIINKFEYINNISYNTVVSQILYNSFAIKIQDSQIYINFIKELVLESNKIKSNFLNIFTRFLLIRGTQESDYLLEMLIENELLEPKIIQSQHDNPYFVHHMSEKAFKNLNDCILFERKIKENIEKLSKNDWELHKKLIKEGHNPNEIAKTIQNDEVEKLQEISSQSDFDFNQYVIPSLYERCSFINEVDVTLIDYAAFFGSGKCFKYLLMNGSEIDNTGMYAIAGGNIEIIHLCEQNNSSFNAAYEIAIEFHHNSIFKYLYDNKIIEIDNLEELGMECIKYHNYETFKFLQENGMKINNFIINQAAEIGNIFLVKYFLETNQRPKDILVYAAKSNNLELIYYFLDQKGIDVNVKDQTLFNILMY